MSEAVCVKCEIPFDEGDNNIQFSNGGFICKYCLPIDALQYKDGTIEGVSLRGSDWLHFASLVVDHIEDYTVPQYGDKGSDNVTDWEPEDCLKQLDKYRKRFGKNQRPNQDKLDLLKMAHYVQMCWTKLEEAKCSNNNEE